LTDPDRGELERWAPIVEDKLRTLPALVDVGCDSQPPGPAARIVVNRALAARLGLDLQVIDETLYDAFGARQVAEIYTDSEQYFTLLDMAPAFQATPAALELVKVTAKSGTEVPLLAFAHVEQALASTSVAHRGQFPVEHIHFNLARGVSIGEAIGHIHALERGLGKPRSLQTSFEGTAKEFETSLASQPWLFGAAIFVIYIVLGILYESFIHPLTVLSSLPPAGLGALLALLACGYNLNVIGMIGIILLLGIVKKNAIMMVDFAIAAETRGKPPREAIIEACSVRFRPIVMTTAAALLGALPLAFATGAGSELRRPLGIAVVGGLLLSQVLTLYTTPVIHLLLRRLSQAAFVRLRRTVVKHAPTE
jgi:multidrug efflux pump subunit AcrB